MSVEPVGIVISNGKRDEPTTAFWAYMWGPAPERIAAGKTPRAA
ncbi:MAG: hypothetical protein ACREND_12800 [Gemmatimonadaceae bacterium]